MSEKLLQVEGGLGDAEPSQVLAGATFTSETGFNQTGTFEPKAENITYDNTNSGLDATNAQEAIDVLNSDLYEKVHIKSQQSNENILSYAENRPNGTFFPFNYNGYDSSGTPKNAAPTNSSGTAYINKISDNHITIMAIPLSGGIYVRNKNNGVWDTKWEGYAKL